MFKTLIRRSSEILYVVILLFCMAMLVVFPNRYVGIASDGIKIWALTVLPSLLPFFFLTALITRTRVLTKLSDKAGGVTKFLYGQSGIAAYVQLMSFLSGYPIGAKLVSDLYSSGSIDEESATSLSVISSTSGPLFIVGGIGVGMFKSGKIGYIILVSHYLSSIITGVIFRSKRTLGNRRFRTVDSCDNVLYESAYSSVVSVAVIGAFIAVFYTFANVLIDSGVTRPFQSALSWFLGENVSEGLIVGLIECTTGIRAIANAPISAATVGLSCAVVTLGGLSVWCQSIVYLSRAKVKIKTFILAKLVQAIIAFLLCYLIFYFF